MDLFHKRHFYLMLGEKTNGQFRKSQLFQLKMGIPYCVYYPIPECICLVSSGNVYPFLL